MRRQPAGKTQAAGQQVVEEFEAAGPVARLGQGLHTLAKKALKVVDSDTHKTRIPAPASHCWSGLPHKAACDATHRK